VLAAGKASETRREKAHTHSIMNLRRARCPGPRDRGASKMQWLLAHRGARHARHDARQCLLGDGHDTSLQACREAVVGDNVLNSGLSLLAATSLKG